jgi:ADP-ribosylglycohydrolase
MMRGAIAGDVIGAPYEWNRIKTTDFPLFRSESHWTDDTVLTVAVAEALLGDGDYRAALRSWGVRYPHAGYGGMFRRWLASPSRRSPAYNSFGNGSAMRVSAVGWLRHSTDAVLAEAAKSAEVTHNHPEGVKGAQAVALAILRARTGISKLDIRHELTDRFGYDLERRLEDIRPVYQFDETCQGSVPEALIAFFEADSWEAAVRNAVSLGGDADTQACIAGSVAEAFYGGVPAEIWSEVEVRLPPDMRRLLGRFDTTVRAGPTQA